MFSLKTNTDYKLVSYNIYELWRFIVSNNFDYEICLDHIPISYDAFLNLFLKRTKNWKDYHSLYLKLKPTLNIIEYVNLENQK